MAKNSDSIGRLRMLVCGCTASNKMSSDNVFDSFGNSTTTIFVKRAWVWANSSAATLAQRSFTFHAANLLWIHKTCQTNGGVTSAAQKG